jgi:hypothetical protein
MDEVAEISRVAEDSGFSLITFVDEPFLARDALQAAGAGPVDMPATPARVYQALRGQPSRAGSRPPSVRSCGSL